MGGHQVAPSYRAAPLLAPALLALTGCGRSTIGGLPGGEVRWPFDLEVSGLANLHGAGHAVPPAPGGNGGGILPPMLSLPPGSGRILTERATGTILLGVGLSFEPDGGPDSAWVDPYGGLSGYQGNNGALAAVFLDDGEPADPPPATLDCGDASYRSLSPGLRQLFIVGDGLTGTGSGDRQQFEVPDDATRLFFGATDAPADGNDLPGSFDDNGGAFEVIGEIILPSTVGGSGR